MPGRARGRAPVSRPQDGRGGRADRDARDDYGYGYDESFDDERGDAHRPSRGRPAPPRGTGPGGAPNGRPEPEPLYARDHTPLGYDGGDPDDPPLLTHGGGNGRDAYDGDDADGYERYDEDDDYDDEYEDDPYDDYDDYEDDEDYDDDAYGVGDGPLAVPPPGSGGRPLGPADVEELDPSMTDALARVDLGSMQVPVPFGAELVLEPAESGRPQAAHIMLPEGRIAVSALAAPRSAGLWSDLADEIEESLRNGGARVRTATGDWGRELHARTDTASSVFIGADGPRWMVYGVATASLETIEALDVELRRVMRGIIVVRGKLPYPPRTVLPLQKAEDRERAAAENKPRGASITVSVPAARSAGASGATPAGAASTGATAGDRNGAPRNGTPTGVGRGRGTPSGPPRGGGPDRPRNGAAPNGAVRNGAVPNGAVPNGAVPNGAVPNGAVPNGAVPNGAVPNGAVPNGAVPNGAVPNGAPANGAGRDGSVANGASREGAVPDGAAANGARPNGARPNGAGRNGAGPNGAGRPGPQDSGRPGDRARDPRDPAGRGPGSAGVTGGRPGPDAERTQSVRAAGSTGAQRTGRTSRPAPDDATATTRTTAVPGRSGRTGAAPLRPAAEQNGLPARGAPDRRPEHDGPFAGRGPADTGATRSRPAPVGDAREPEYEPEAPVTRMLPTVDAPGAAHTGANPAVAPLPEPEPVDEPDAVVDEPTPPRSRTARRRPEPDAAATPRRTARDTGRARAGRRAEPVETVGPTGTPVADTPVTGVPELTDVPQTEAVEEPPVRRDPAVISLLDQGIVLPELPGTSPVGRGRRHADDATTPPAGHGAVVDPPAATDDLLAGLRGDPRNDPPAGPLSAPPGDLPDDGGPIPRSGPSYGSVDLWGADPAPSFPDPLPDPEPVPISRMAIEDIPLGDVPLLDAELDSEPAPEPLPVADAPVADPLVTGTEPGPRAQLPRRRPGATRRRGTAAPAEAARAGRRRRAAEDDVLSDWMSAEIAARPSGRHAQPGAPGAGVPGGGAHDGPATNGTPRSARARRRAEDRTGPDADLFRPVLDDPPDGDAGRHRR